MVNTLDELGKAELAADRLVLADEDALAGSDKSEAHDAVAQLRELSDLFEEAQSMSKDELIEALPESVVEAIPVGGDDLPAKSDLMEAFVAVANGDEDNESTATVPAPAPETTATKRRVAANKKQENA